MKLRKVFHRAQASSSHPLRLLTLCAFFAVGIIAGQIMQYMVGVDGSTELATYLRGYAGMITQQEALAPSSALQVVIIYFRGPLLLFLLGFCTFGAVAIPLVCALQGFILSFAVACFSASLGYEGVLLSLAAFGLRGAVTLPCSLIIGQWAFDKTIHRLRGEPFAGSTAQRRRLAVCFFVLALGAVLEIILVPQLFLLVLSRSS